MFTRLWEQKSEICKSEKTLDFVNNKYKLISTNI